MTAVDRLFLSEFLVKSAAMAALQRLFAGQMLPPKTREVDDLRRNIHTEGGNYNLDAWAPASYHKSLPELHPAFTNDMRTMLINSHGVEGFGDKGPSFVMGTQPWPRAEFGLTGLGLNPGTSKFRFTLPDVARMMGPKTNDIHNLILANCQSGHCAPGEAFKLFPNLTNVISSKPYESISARDIRQAFEGNTNRMVSTLKVPQSTNWQGVWNKYVQQPFDVKKVFNQTSPKTP